LIPMFTSEVIPCMMCGTRDDICGALGRFYNTERNFEKASFVVGVHIIECIKFLIIVSNLKLVIYFNRSHNPD
jgi:hypothetical protein